jgi:tetratricopeptide (TPR) repeat protein
MVGREETATTHTLGAAGEPVPRAAPEPALIAGARVGRYVILETLGAGGMGVVYVAYDPELDRRIALKLLRPGTEQRHPDAARARMIREAQALARLAHPNVVPIYDVGAIGDQIFLAMELVKGITLTEWSRRHDHGWRQIVDVFAQAGRGLAAAHAARLVHRDFKPDNVLVGADGRARVLDFGLARADEGDPGATDAVPPSPVLDERLSMTGAVLGTPAYMAPEQRQGRSDARSDQFSFCVALDEALHGGRAKSGDAPAPPPRTRAPAWVQRIVARGLAARPEDRFASMNELLAALGRDPRRWAWTAAGALAIALMLAGVAVAARRSRSTPDVCAGATVLLAGAWDADVKERVRGALDVERSPLGRSSWSVIERRLDAWAADWQRLRRASCMATRVERAQSEPVLDLRTQCFDRAIHRAAAMTAFLSEPSPQLAAEAAKVIDGLPDLSRCGADAVQASQVAPPDGAIAAQVEQLRGELDRSEATIHAGRYQDALAGAERLDRLARELAYVPVEARADLNLARVQAELRRDHALASAQRAYRTATACGDMHLGAEALVLEARILVDAKDYEQASAISRDGSVMAGRLGDERLAVTLEQMGGQVLFERADYAAAVAKLEQVVLACRRLGQLELVPTALATLGLGYRYSGKLDAARTAWAEGIAITEQLRGPEHPELAMYLHQLARLESTQRHHDEAVRLAERARRIAVQGYGADSVQAGIVTDGLGETLLYRGDYRAALAVADELLGHQLVDDVRWRALRLRAYVLADLERFAEAAASGREMVAVMGKVQGEHHPDVEQQRIILISWEARAGIGGPPLPRLAGVQAVVRGFDALTQERLNHVVCWALVELEEAAAVPRCQETLEYEQRTHGTNLAQIQSWAGKADLYAGDARSAIGLFEAALPDMVLGGDARDIASTRFAFARALLLAGGDRARAHGLATAARDAFAKELAPEAPSRRAVERWLAENFK